MTHLFLWNNPPIRATVERQFLYRRFVERGQPRQLREAVSDDPQHDEQPSPRSLPPQQGGSDESPPLRHRRLQRIKRTTPLTDFNSARPMMTATQIH